MTDIPPGWQGDAKRITPLWDLACAIRWPDMDLERVDKPDLAEALRRRHGVIFQRPVAVMTMRPGAESSALRKTSVRV